MDYEKDERWMPHQPERVAMRKQTKLWTMRDGTKIRICDMTNSHLVNTMRMLKRGAMVIEQDTGEISCDDWQYYISDIYWAMQDDMERRLLEIETKPKLPKEPPLKSVSWFLRNQHKRR